MQLEKPFEKTGTSKTAKCPPLGLRLVDDTQLVRDLFGTQLHNLGGVNKKMLSSGWPVATKQTL